MYLLQLVQALKYEDYDCIRESYELDLYPRDLDASAAAAPSRVIGEEGVAVGNSCFVSFIEEPRADGLAGAMCGVSGALGSVREV